MVQVYRVIHSDFVSQKLLQVLSVCPGLITFLYFHFYVLIGVLLKGMVESCLLFNDELLTPNIDEVMAV